MSARCISFQSLRFSHRNPTFARSSGNTRPTWSGALPMSMAVPMQCWRLYPYRLWGIGVYPPILPGAPVWK